MQIVIKGTLFQCTFFDPQYLLYRKYFLDQKLAIEISVTIKWEPGGKIWDWYMILHYFPEYLTPMLTLGPRSYRSPNFVLVLPMWENLESTVKSPCEIEINIIFKHQDRLALTDSVPSAFSIFWWKTNLISFCIRFHSKDGFRGDNSSIP